MHIALLLLSSTIIFSGDCGSIDNLQHSPINRRIRSDSCLPNEYPYEGRCCLLCPAGTHVSKHCTAAQTQGQCAPCTAGSNFTAGPNGMESCVSCRPCRSDDQVQVAECTATANYKCQCKPDTFCIKECNIICTKCSSCPEGHRVRNQCTSTSDTVCEKNVTYHPITEKPETPKTSDANDLALAILLPFLLLAVIGIIILIIILKCRHGDKKQPGTATDAELQKHLMDGSIDNPSQASTPEAQRILLAPGQPAVENVVNVGATDDVRSSGQNAFENELLIPCSETTPQLGASAALNETKARPERGGESEGTKHRAAIGKTCEPQLSDEEWLECYNCLREQVLPDKWKELMRNLGLSEADIRCAHMDHNGVQEVNYQMLLLWRQQKGHGATMHEILCALDKMHLRGCREKIVCSLSKKGIYFTSHLESRRVAELSLPSTSVESIRKAKSF